MKYAELREYDVSNWSGINSTIFFSGCTHNCKGCFNKVAQDFNYGKPYTKEVEDLFVSYIKDEHINGACILGGEPFQQDLDILLNLVKRIKKETGKPIYIWSGYLWENLIKDKKKLEVLQYVDVIIDGRFDEDKKDLKLKHKGSSNQREINVKESLKQNKVVLINE